MDCAHIFMCIIGNYGTMNTIPIIISFINWCSSTAAQKLRIVKQYNLQNGIFLCSAQRLDMDTW